MVSQARKLNWDGLMKYSAQHTFESSITSSVIALHCSLSSGHQWARLAEQLASKHQVITPDISGYGNNPGPSVLPTTLAEEVDLLNDRLGEATGPIHLVGHSYGGAIAFKIATDSPLASRVRSLLAFWKGSGPEEKLSSNALVRMIEHAEKLAFDFTAILAEQNVTAAAATIRVPTLLISGGLSPYLTQRVTGRLASTIGGAETRYLPAAGHMLPISHAGVVNADIARHIARADEFASLSLALGEASTEADVAVKI